MCHPTAQYFYYGTDKVPDEDGAGTKNKIVYIGHVTRIRAIRAPIPGAGRYVMCSRNGLPGAAWGRARSFRTFRGCIYRSNSGKDKTPATNSCVTSLLAVQFHKLVLSERKGDWVCLNSVILFRNAFLRLMFVAEISRSLHVIFPKPQPFRMTINCVYEILGFK